MESILKMVGQILRSMSDAPASLANFFTSSSGWAGPREGSFGFLKKLS